jgi:hypothetical protein
MARSGYEIRLDVLRMAKDLADDRFHQELQRRQEIANRNNTEWSLPCDTREKDSLSIADELYTFVESKD